MWVIDELDIFFNVINGCLFYQALTDDFLLGVT